MKIYYIANSNRCEFMYVSPSEHTLHLYDVATIYNNLKHCLAAWYSPIIGSNGTPSQRLPRTTTQLINRNGMFVYRQNIITNLIDRAPLPIIDHRYVRSSDMENDMMNIPTGALIAPANYILDGYLYKRTETSFQHKRINEVIIFNDIGEA